MTLIEQAGDVIDDAIQLQDQVKHVAQYVKVGRINVTLDELSAAISHLDNARRHLTALAEGRL